MPTKNQSARAADFHLASFLPFRLVAVSEAVQRLFAQSYEGSLDLTIPEIRALSVIAEFGTLSPTAVGQHTWMDKVKVSRATQSLAAKGLVHQRPDPNDGRSRLLRLTRKGVATHTRFVSLANRLEAELFVGLSQADATALNRVLTKITTRLETTGRTDQTG
jgi:DNA-binding MarR family transcriptional regulator